MNKIILGNCLEELKTIESNSIDLIYIDPPFNTGNDQIKTSITTTEHINGDRIGFGQKRYSTTVVSKMFYQDNIPEYHEFMSKCLKESFRVLRSTGNMFIHLDQREVHYVKIIMDGIFDRDNYVESIYWTWDYGARTKKKFPIKTNEILWYAKEVNNYYFDITECDRIPYMSPDLVGKEKTEFGKYPTNCWWLSIVGTNSHEKTGYPTQKPYKLLERIVKTACPINGMVLDFFAGSGTTGEAAIRNNREFILIDNNDVAISVIKERLGNFTKGLMYKNV